jgi:hypothetical protein
VVSNQTGDHVTLTLTRYEYANLYHTMSDWYNVFLMTKFFNVTKANVVLVDSHPAGPLDTAWTTLFGDVTRLSGLNPWPTRFDDVVWVLPGNRGPLVQHAAPRLPLADQFRRSVTCWVHLHRRSLL